ncbi:hypothetical protein EW146_g5346 [Bondarzewia mesenterica]|uniref:Uncharacterized protein n=1 Tax=Bondarzewia mesenterica TaxID=1095465 RepID=A0A4S4LRT0_9AGAM|nr:hypothetical protein EW146_g5346 [Bondarzewia mesenterica]
MLPLSSLPEEEIMLSIVFMDEDLLIIIHFKVGKAKGDDDMDDDDSLSSILIAQNPEYIEGTPTYVLKSIMDFAKADKMAIGLCLQVKLVVEEVWQKIGRNSEAGSKANGKADGEANSDGKVRSDEEANGELDIEHLLIAEANRELYNGDGQKGEEAPKEIRPFNMKKVDSASKDKAGEAKAKETAGPE